MHHDPHVLYTLSAVQTLAIFDALDRIDVDKVAAFMAGHQQVRPQLFMIGGDGLPLCL